MKATRSSHVGPDEILFVANSRMALSKVTAYLRSFDNTFSPPPKIWVISTSSKALNLPLNSDSIHIVKFHLLSFVKQKFISKRVVEFIKSTKCSNIVFYDFAQDNSIFYLAKILISSNLDFTVCPAAPIPSYQLERIHFLSLLISQPFLIAKYLLFKSLSYPIGLYSYGNYRHKFFVANPHICLSDSSITVEKFSVDKFKKSDCFLPSTIRYLYIENCEYLLSQDAKLLVRSVLQDISLTLSERGVKLFFKSRPNNSVSNIISPSSVYRYQTDLPCEEINMNAATLITIASIGALSSQASKVISIVDFVACCTQSRRDLSILTMQSDYAKSFAHLNLLFPQTRSDIIRNLY